jgi:hypothetical protein
MGIEFKPDINRFVILALHNIADGYRVGDRVAAESLKIYSNQEIVLRDLINKETICIAGAMVGGWINKLRMESGNFSSDGRQVIAFDDTYLNET